MKNICFLIGNLNNSGGTERVTTLIANQLALNNYHIHILSLSEGENPFFKLHENIQVDHLFKEKISLRKHYISAVLKLRKYILKNKIETLIVVDSISCVFTVPACLGLNINHICWEHFNLKVNLNSSFRSLGRFMAAKWCCKIITLTEQDKIFWDDYFKLNNSKKVISIANPSPYLIQNNSPSLTDKTILCIGRLTYQKGFDLLILAWKEIANLVPEWTIDLVGTGEDEQMLKQMAECYGVSKSINFLGQQKNVTEFYTSASFFCMSSRFEGLPMVLLEAQSFGLPIVSFDCDTGPRELINNGVNGFLVSKENVNELSKYLLKAINLNNVDYHKMSELSKSNSENYMPHNIVKKWISVI